MDEQTSYAFLSPSPLPHKQAPMNSNRRADHSQKAAAPLHSYDFDFGLVGSSTLSKSQSAVSLKAQKHNNSQPPQLRSASSAAASWAPQSGSSSAPSWTPAPSSIGSQSSASRSQFGGDAWGARPLPMAGDISGKSWARTDVSRVGNTGLVGGLSRGAEADMFKDLLKVPIGRSSATKPLQKDAAFSMANVAVSLPKGLSLNQAKSAQAKTPVSSESFANIGTRPDSEMGNFGQPEAFASAFKKQNDNTATSASSSDLFGSFESSAFNPVGASVDPFTFSDSDGSRSGSTGKVGEDAFGDFQEGSSTAPTSSSENKDPFAASTHVPVDLFADPSIFKTPLEVTPDDPFSFLQNTGVAASSRHDPSNVDPFGISSTGDDDPFSSFQSAHSGSVSAKMSGFEDDPFEMLRQSSASRNTAADSKASDPLENLWSPSISSKTCSQNPPVQADWDFEPDFGGDEGEMTTELEGLPPPPPGITVIMAKNKGLENYKQGQFADAIKWLSWATELIGKNGDDSMSMEVLTCRASCFKEVGEYKKAVVDCSKVIELDDSNTPVLLQRALLYESIEKYKLGVADLREVIKRVSYNKLASNTLSRLVKMVD